MLKLENIKKSFKVGEHIQEVLRGIDLELKQGDMIAIQGRSGSGKSTLLHIIACLDRQDSGNYKLDGVEVSSLNDDKASLMRNEKIGIVLQDYVLLQHRSVLFNVMLPMYFNKTPYRDMKKRALEALEVVGLKNMYKKNANKLSGGERQRVAIARAIVNNPKLILADEPTGALDYDTGQKIMKLLQDINAVGTTIIIVTHDDNIARMCKKIYVMEDGKLK